MKPKQLVCRSSQNVCMDIVVVGKNMDPTFEYICVFLQF